jgi:hypothetical protein
VLLPAQSPFGLVRPALQSRTHNAAPRGVEFTPRHTRLSRLRIIDAGVDFINRTRELVWNERRRTENEIGPSAKFQLFRSIANFLMFKVLNELQVGHFGEYAQARNRAHTQSHSA